MKQGRIPSNQVRGFRMVDQRTLTADNQQFVIDLPRGPAIERVVMDIRGTINNSVAWTAVRTLAPLHLFKRIDWVLNGNITLHSASGIGTYLANGLLNRAYPKLVPPAGAGTGAQTIGATIFLDRISPDMVRPKDAVLKTDEGVTQNQLRVTMGAIGDFYTGSGTSAYTTVTVTTYTQDYQEAPDQTGRTPDPLYYLKFSEQQVVYSATGTNQITRISTGNRLRALAIRQEISGDGSDSNISFVRLIRGGDTRISVPVNVLQSLNEVAQLAAPSIRPAGAYYLDLGNPGMWAARYSEMWPLPSNADVQMISDVAVAPVTLRIMQIEGIDLQRAAS
jgi:hypothetical protein